MESSSTGALDGRRGGQRIRQKLGQLHFLFHQQGWTHGNNLLYVLIFLPRKIAFHAGRTNQVPSDNPDAAIAMLRRVTHLE